LPADRDDDLDTTTSSSPRNIHGAGAVVLTQPVYIDNDFIFAMLGAELPIRFMKGVSIR
jgi:hypothetical protein